MFCSRTFSTNHSPFAIDIMFLHYARFRWWYGELTCSAWVDVMNGLSIYFRRTGNVFANVVTRKADVYPHLGTSNMLLFSDEYLSSTRTMKILSNSTEFSGIILKLS